MQCNLTSQILLVQSPILLCRMFILDYPNLVINVRLIRLGILLFASRRHQVTHLLDGESLIEVVLNFLEAIHWKDERKPKRDCPSV